MCKLVKNIISKYFVDILVIIPIFTIPFIQTKLLLDISLGIRFLALNIWLIILSVFIIFFQNSCFDVNKLRYNKFLLFYSIYIIFSLLSVFISNNYADAIYSFFSIFHFGMVIFLYYLIFKNYLVNINHITLILNVFGISVLVLCFNDFLKVINLTGITHQSIYEITATFSHKNILSEVLFFIFPFSIYQQLHKNKWLKLLGLINFIGVIFFIVILITRAVWISIFIGFVATFILFFILSDKQKISNFFNNKKSYILIISFIVIIISSLFIYSKLDSFETLKKSSQKILKLYDSSQHRIELWKRTIDISKESPIIGKGLATWKIEVLKYGNRNLQSEDNITFYQRPHNDYLWTLSEQGVIGLVLLLIVYFLIIYYLIKIIKTIEISKELLFYYMLLYYIIGFLIFSFFSFPRERVEHSLFLGIIFGLIVAKYNILFDKKPIKLLKNKFKKIATIFIGVLLITGTVVAISRLYSEVHIRLAFQARSAGNWNKVINEIEKSESVFYKIDPFSTPIKWYSGEANLKIGNIERAFIDYQQCYKLNPYHIHVLNNLATCYELKGNHVQSIKLYRDAIKISPKFEDALLNLTAVYYNINKIDSAYYFISKIDTSTNNEKYLLFNKALQKKRIK